MTSLINRDWHAANRMPKNPTEAERIIWHRAHAAHCQCRPIPPGLAALIARHEAPSEAPTLRPPVKG